MIPLIKFLPVRPGFSELPKKSFESDAGFDVIAQSIEKKNDGLVVCYLGFATEIPEGWKGVIVPRSSLTKTKWAMLNSPGQVDASYRGEWQVRFTYVGDWDSPEFPFKAGDRIAQIYFEKVYPVALQITSVLSQTDRGSGGFGHTGGVSVI